MSRMIHLGDRLDLSAHAFATNVVAALGMRGSGKSNVMTVAVEGLLAADVQVVVLDYVGIWWGLRLLPSGKPSPFEIPVLGGKHGDIPLVAPAGRQVAEALAASHSSAVLDISAFTKGDRIKFAADFGEAFFHAKKSHGGPVFLLLEEAQRFVPQVIRFSDPALSRCLGAFEEIAEVGRNYGIGLGLISQRPQKINKDVLNLAELVFAFQTNGVLERKAIAEWVQEKGAAGRDQVTGELPSLPRGTALVWSPSTFKIYGKYAFDKKTTYDAGATPDSVRAAVTVRPLDLKSLEGAMESVVAEAKASDPRALRARIAELERAAHAHGSAMAATVVAPAQIVEKSVLKQVDIVRLERLVEKLQVGEAMLISGLEVQRDRIAQAQQAVVSELGNMTTALKAASASPRPAFVDPGRGPRQAYAVKKKPFDPLDILTPQMPETPLSKCARALLGVLAQRGRASDSQISMLSGYRITSSSFANGLSELRTKGLIEGSPDWREITDAGREAAGPVEPLPSGPELLAYWMRRLSKAEATMLKVIHEHGTISRGALSTESGYSITSSSFANALSGLRTLELIYGPSGGELTIADIFNE